MQAVDTSVLRMYKRVKPLSFAHVFYDNTWGFAEHDMGRKRNLEAIYLFNMAKHLMNIHCRKKVLPSMTILGQMASYWHSSVNSEISDPPWYVASIMYRYLRQVEQWNYGSMSNWSVELSVVAGSTLK